MTTAMESKNTENKNDQVSGITEMSEMLKKQFAAVFNKGVSLFSAGNYQQAEKQFLEAMAFGIDLDKCTKSVASCCQMQEDWHVAINYYELALLYSKSDNIDCYHFLGVCYVKTQDFQKAKDYLQQYITLAKDIEGTKEVEATLKSAKLYLQIADKKIDNDQNQ